MDFDLTGDQKLIQESIREFLEKECPYEKVRELEEDELGYDPVVWRKMAGLGYLGIAFPEACGGTGGSFIDLMILAEEMGRAAFPSPFFSTVVRCGLTVLEGGTEKQRLDLLGGISRGELILSLARYEEGASYEMSGVDTRARQDGARLVLDGVKLFVKDGNIAHKLLVVARGPGSGFSLCLVDGRAKGVAVSRMPTIGMDNTCEVILKGVSIDRGDVLGEAGGAEALLERTMVKGSLVKSAEMLGGCRACIDMTAAYAKKRKQYGMAIGSFQIIQHYMADMLLAYDTCHNYLYKVGWMADEGMECAAGASIVKASVNRSYRLIAEKAVQIHGAIGTTREGNIGLYYRRAKASEYEMGDTGFHYGRIARHLLG